MTLVVRTFGSSELPAAARVLAEAFQTDPLYSFVAPDAEQRRRWLPIMKREVLRLTQPLGHNYVAADEDRLLGVLGLTPPGCWPPPIWRQVRLSLTVVLLPTPTCPSLPELLPLRRYASVFDEIHLREPHWYIDVIGVAPSEQGRGVGKHLMQRALDLADGSKHPVWLETQTEANVGYYESFGFQVAATRQPVPGGPPTWGMVRPRGG